METKNNNQVPQEQALHLIQSGLNILRDEIFRLQTEIEKLKQPEFKVLRGGYTYKDDEKNWYAPLVKQGLVERIKPGVFKLRKSKKITPKTVTKRGKLRYSEYANDHDT